ncbi:acetylornithine deacetylase [Metabacillus crassostreae]|uniref:peptidase n=1 Tax=Metabacillus crassostreae TaxID=929098 RepID=UPI0019598323|nr:peptidase [Metabacillus crassostreae]MBM7603759.1 acetylornithine deacetylase [Metabacillus crassostreae]
MDQQRKLVKEEIHKWLSSNREDGINLLRKLVQASSTQKNEKVAQEIVIETIKKIGLEIDIWEPDGMQLQTHPFFACDRNEFKESPNVVGILKGSGGGRSIILNGHIDVVPAGDVSQWADDPFSGKVVEGKLYGRGSTDMKGGNVALLLAITVIRELGIQLKGDVIFQSVIEEESGGLGTLAAIERGYVADAAIIPEPTNMKIFPKQQGSIWFRISVHGRSAHGGTRYEGVSAIENAFDVVKHIGELEKHRNNRIKDNLYKNIPIPIPINIGKIEGGDWPSSVADLVKLEGRMGISPDETIEEAKNEMTNWLKTLPMKNSWFDNNPVEIEWFGARWVPGTIDLDHKLMKCLSSSFIDVTGEQAIIEASPWGTDGGLLTNVAATPTIVFGPGKTEKAHHPDEYIELDKLFEAAEIIALTVVEWCGACHALLFVDKCRRDL